MLHPFTRNYTDHCTDAGFQFEFHCDCCGNGFKSSFIRSTTYGKRKSGETLSRGLGSIGGMFGGKLSGITNTLENGANLFRDKLDTYGPEWREEQERAFDAAQEEIKPYFTKCPSCNKWVCADCWNEEEGLCIECAPREASYVAKARNQAMRRNIDELAETATVWTGKLETRTTLCPHCGKPSGSGKFCNSCGKPLNQNICKNCGAPLAPGLKFCGECGAKVETNPVCPNCGFENAPGTKFCGECGTKL
ncbi:MAG: zinc ribbon domain-containing protein [Lachnospiraceae bacterium]|nr:zinc ribbon domain-containing protein [Lachnospiraceae bacterium]